MDLHEPLTGGGGHKFPNIDVNFHRYLELAIYEDSCMDIKIIFSQIGRGVEKMILRFNTFQYMAILSPP